MCIDVANGYTESFVRFVAKFRERYPHLVIMAGNVVTGEMTEELILSGADIVKVGIGPGSVCTTRNMTGVGYPQLSAIIECADAAHGLEGRICADGGCTTPGDVAKAFGGGADFVMLGGMLAGHDECSGDVVERTAAIQRFYGMSSRTAMEKYAGGVAIPRSRRQRGARARTVARSRHRAGDPGRRALGVHLRWRAELSEFSNAPLLCAYRGRRTRCSVARSSEVTNTPAPIATGAGKGNYCHNRLLAGVVQILLVGVAWLDFYSSTR